ncbi:hypothetical protein BJV78DRAFT_1283260 [Lactifluus subvellereus]|nr:hypothetical protein BJV78DRAFT_1283260 [Lactifluus subvellereus]
MCEDEDGEVQACSEDSACSGKDLVDDALGLCGARGEGEVCENGDVPCVGAIELDEDVVDWVLQCLLDRPTSPSVEHMPKPNLQPMPTHPEPLLLTFTRLAPPHAPLVAYVGAATPVDGASPPTSATTSTSSCSSSSIPASTNATPSSPRRARTGSGTEEAESGTTAVMREERILSPAAAPSGLIALRWSGTPRAAALLTKYVGAAGGAAATMAAVAHRRHKGT